MHQGRGTTNDKVVLASAIALFLLSFVPWFSFTEQFSRNGWDYPVFGVIPVLLGLLMLTEVVVSRMSRAVLELRERFAVADVVAGAVAALLLLIKLIIGDKLTIVGFGSVTFDRRFGIYFAFLAAVGLAVGGILGFKKRAH